MASLDTTVQRLKELTGDYCDARLDDEYKALAHRLVDAMAEAEPEALQRGKAEVWAAGLMHCLTRHNGLFFGQGEYPIRVGDIAEDIGASVGALTRRSNQIDDTLHVSSDPSYRTAAAQQRYLEFMEAIRRAMSSVSGRELTLEEVEEYWQSGAPFGMGIWAADDDAEFEEVESFVDRDHAVAGKYYDILEMMEKQGPTDLLIRRLQRLIEQDPDFLDPYLVLADIHADNGDWERCQDLIDTAYQRAIATITDEQGEWPERIDWGWLENRHLLRALGKKADTLWSADDFKGAGELFFRILDVCPEDNMGVRFSLLAIAKGVPADAFDAIFDNNGYWSGDIHVWFNNHAPNYPAIFGRWLELAKQWE